MKTEKDAIVAKISTKKLHPQKSWKPQRHLHRTKLIPSKQRSNHLSQRQLSRFDKKCPRCKSTVSQVTHLAKQLYPNNTICILTTPTVSFNKPIRWPIKEPYTYLFIDLTPTCPNEIDPGFSRQINIMCTNLEYN